MAAANVPIQPWLGLPPTCVSSLGQAGGTWREGDENSREDKAATSATPHVALSDAFHRRPPPPLCLLRAPLHTLWGVMSELMNRTNLPTGCPPPRRKIVGVSKRGRAAARAVRAAVGGAGMDAGLLAVGG
eukprot:360440-Chlamydomonas_euryale.AAC.3